MSNIPETDIPEKTEIEKNIELDQVVDQIFVEYGVEKSGSLN